MTHLTEAVEHLDDALGVDGHGNRRVQGVRRELVLVNELRPSHWFRDGHKEVVRLSDFSVADTIWHDIARVTEIWIISFIIIIITTKQRRTCNRRANQWLPISFVIGQMRHRETEKKPHQHGIAYISNYCGTNQDLLQRSASTLFAYYLRRR